MTKLPAGWYPDPEDDSTQRYWDGEQWLDIPAPAARQATSGNGKPKGLSKKHRMLAWLAIGVVLVGAAAGVTWKIVADQQAAAVLAEEEQAALKAEQVALEAERAKVEEQETADELERGLRQLSVAGVEDSVKAMAEGHVADGMLTGPIISATCSPVGGGSTDDLDQNTTVFSCFVANVDNGDGTLSGYKYNATMNWDTGRYSYGLGAP